MQHAVAHVRDGRRGDHLDLLQRRVADVDQQPLAGTEHDRGDVQVHLVEQPGRQVLLHGLRAAGDATFCPPGRRPGLLQRGFDAVGDEGEGGAAQLQRRPRDGG